MKLKQTGPWIEHSGPDADVVVSSRARLARNLTDLPFVNQASDAQRREILQLVRSLPFASERGEELVWIDLQQSTSEDRRLLFERHLVSRQFIESVSPRAVAIADDEQLSVMVNEEDHLRMQVLLPGLEPGGGVAKSRRVRSTPREACGHRGSSAVGIPHGVPDERGHRDPLLGDAPPSRPSTHQ